MDMSFGVGKVFRESIAGIVLAGILVGAKKVEIKLV